MTLTCALTAPNVARTKVAAKSLIMSAEIGSQRVNDSNRAKRRREWKYSRRKRLRKNVEKSEKVPVAREVHRPPFHSHAVRKG